MTVHQDHIILPVFCHVYSLKSISGFINLNFKRFKHGFDNFPVDLIIIYKQNAGIWCSEAMHFLYVGFFLADLDDLLRHTEGKCTSLSITALYTYRSIHLLNKCLAERKSNTGAFFSMIDLLIQLTVHQKQFADIFLTDPLTCIFDCINKIYKSILHLFTSNCNVDLPGFCVFYGIRSIVQHYLLDPYRITFQVLRHVFLNMIIDRKFLVVSRIYDRFHVLNNGLCRSECADSVR